MKFNLATYTEPQTCEIDGISVTMTYDYLRKNVSYSGTINNGDFLIGIYPDTAKTQLGQKRQILKLGRIILDVLKKKLPKPKVSHFVGFQPHKTDTSKHYTLISSDYISYVRHDRKKNRPGYITDSTLNISVEWLHNWQQARENTWKLACAITERLNQ